MPTANEIFLSEIDRIENIVKAEIVKLFDTSAMTQVTSLERLAAMEIYNIGNRLDELGFQDAVNKYLDSYDQVIISSKYVGKIDPSFINEVDLIQNNMEDYLLGQKKRFHSTLTMQMQQNLLNGVPDSKTLKLLTEAIPLKESQLNTVIQTATSNHERNIIGKAFEDEPEQRFEYIQGVVSVTDKNKSETCRSMLTEQDPEGYTKAEIDAGIPTSNGGIVNWQGRVPNFNCTDTWLPI